MTRPAWHQPVDARARAWIERAAGPGWGVTRARPLAGGVAAAVDGVSLEGPGGATQRLVLKRWLRPGWETDDARYTAAREAEILRRLEPSTVPAPGLVALDGDGREAGAPAILMRHVVGRLPRSGDDRRPGRIAAMARTLVAIHALDGGLREVVGAFEAYSPLDRVEIPAGSRRPRLWRSAIERVSVRPAGGRGVFLHRDYHPWNTLWSGGRLTGVVDWTNASWGEPAMDLAHWRANLGTCYGVAVADRVIEAYAEAGGRAIDQTWWDVRILLDFMGDEDWSPPHSLEVADTYLEALLQRD